MTWQLLLMDANAIVCLLIMVRLMFFRKEGKRHRLSVAVLAYLVILAAGFNAFNILLGHYVQVNLGDLLLNSVICMAVWLAHGNLAKVVITE
ncbi:phage holin family protein [Enterobacter hormaechei subsp. xiangfangensis]|uniref:phage holin family protein n=1 Tax=Enterobacter hormaechei TaxID=158836 RepID=UPI003754DD76